MAKAKILNLYFIHFFKLNFSYLLKKEPILNTTLGNILSDRLMHLAKLDIPTYIDMQKQITLCIENEPSINADEFGAWHFSICERLLKDASTVKEHFEELYHFLKGVVECFVRVASSKVVAKFPDLFDEFFDLSIPDNLPQLKALHLHINIPYLICMNVNPRDDLCNEARENSLFQNIEMFLKSGPMGCQLVLNLLSGPHQPIFLADNPKKYTNCWIDLINEVYTYRIHKINREINLKCIVAKLTNSKSKFAKIGKDMIWQKESIRVCEYLFEILLDAYHTKDWILVDPESANSRQHKNKTENLDFKIEVSVPGTQNRLFLYDNHDVFKPLGDFLQMALLGHCFENHYESYLKLLEKLMPLTLQKEKTARMNNCLQFYQLLWLENASSPIKSAALKYRAQLFTNWLTPLKKIDPALTEHFFYLPSMQKMALALEKKD
jgi:hypothetical protein